MGLKNNLHILADQLCTWDGQIGKLQYLEGFLNITGEIARQEGNDEVLNALSDCSLAINDIINKNASDTESSINDAISAITRAISNL